LTEKEREVRKAEDDKKKRTSKNKIKKRWIWERGVGYV
jgi:hypothetical protein